VIFEWDGCAADKRALSRPLEARIADKANGIDFDRTAWRVADLQSDG
jgi:hypothetical protein